MSQYPLISTQSKRTPYPPAVKSPPLLGNALAMASDPARFFVNTYREYGSAFRINILNRTYTVLAGPEANLFMAREGNRYLRSREFWQGLLDEFEAKRGLINTDGEFHAELRKIMRRGYSRGAISNRYQELVDITDDMLSRDWPVGESVPVVLAMQRMAAEQLGIMAAGEAPGEYVDDLRTFIRTVLNVLVTKQRPRILLKMPAYKHAKQRVFELGQKMIDEYDPSTIDPERPTVVDDIMAAAQADPSLFIDGELMMAVLGPYFAGLDTVANTTASLVYAVLKHPEVYRRMMEEVDAAFANGVPTPAELRKMTVMHGIVMETLRLYPIGVALVRNADESFTFNGYRVDEGEPIYMASTVSHFLPEFYPDPYTFDIDRYQKPRVEHRQPGAFAPFSLGAHTCLGAGMAEVQIMLTMATLFHRLRLELDPLDYELKQKVAPTPGPESKFKVRVVGRRQ